MNLTNLAAQIAALTHICDRLEQLAAHFVIAYLRDEEHYLALNAEIDRVHSLIDDMNAAYTELADQLADAAYENAGR